MKVTSLRTLEFRYCVLIKQNATFISYSGAKDCLKNLSELYCNSNICPEIFYQLSQICQNIQSLGIAYEKDISNGLADLISAQQNLKYFNIIKIYDCKNLTNMITLLKKIPNNLVKLDIHGGNQRDLPLSFIAKFLNLQELILTFFNISSFEDFKKLRYITFSKLQHLEFRFQCPRNELLIEFLENNGKNLKKIFICMSNDSLNLAIVKFCPNIRLK